MHGTMRVNACVQPDPGREDAEHQQHMREQAAAVQAQIEANTAKLQEGKAALQALQVRMLFRFPCIVR